MTENSNILVLVFGLPGTGKTTFARALAAAMNAVHLNTDVIRAELGKRGQYDEDTKMEVYQALMDHTRRSIEAGKTVIVDGTMYKRKLQTPFSEMAVQASVPIYWIEITADETVIRRRVSKHRPYSEADYEVYLKIKAEYEKPEGNSLTLRSDTNSPEEMVDKALAHLRESPPGLTREQIDLLIANFPEPATPKLIETHISWVVLGMENVYKIKKPVKYSFLDFSTLEKRKFYCQRELELNQRLTENMYREVVPICQSGSKIVIGKQDQGTIIDYAVRMKRMDNTRQMNLLLEKEEVTFRQMEQLAEKLASFHAFTDVIEAKLNLHLLWEDFADVAKVLPFLRESLGADSAGIISESIDFVTRFLKAYAPHFRRRHESGFTIDGHGDLHSKNILLLEEPVVFDCIEFNDHFRHVDVLDELAFFCLDLDFYRQEHLAAHFLQHYLLKYPCIAEPEDWHIFTYYKLYRANVRLKVQTLKAMQIENPSEIKQKLGLIEAYLTLLKGYLRHLQSVTGI